MGLSWILFRRSFHHSKGRLALIILAIAFGTCISLGFFSFFNAFGNPTPQTLDRSIRHANEARTQAENESQTKNYILIDASAPVQQRQIFRVGNQSMRVYFVDCEQTKNPPELFGLSWPKPGEYLVSEGVQRIMDEQPEIRLGFRFGDKAIGRVPRALTKGPDDLVVIMGQRMENTSLGERVAQFDTTGEFSLEDAFYQAILLIGLLVLLFPVLFLVTTASKLGSVQREERYAALRLVGATRRQINQIMGLETSIGAIVGFAFGLIVFQCIQIYLPEISIQSGRFWKESLHVHLWQYLIVGSASFVLVLIANYWGLRSVQTSPLGVVRQQIKEKKVGLGRILPLIFALLFLTIQWMTIKKDVVTHDDLLIFAGILILIMIGLVIAAPWEIQKIARFLARHARNAPFMLGTRYVCRHANRIAQAVSGMILAIFCGVFFLTIVSDADTLLKKASEPSPIKDNIFILSLLDQTNGDQTDQLEKLLKKENYVKKVERSSVLAGAYHQMEAEQAMRILRNPPSIQPKGYLAINFWTNADDPHRYIQGKSIDALKENLVTEQGADLRHSSDALMITLKDPSAIDRLRTKIVSSGLLSLENTHLNLFGGESLSTGNSNLHFIGFMRGIVYLAMGITLMISIISMLVSTYGSLLERRRSLLTLRLSGMQSKELMQMMIVESLGPLVFLSLTTAAIGFGAGWVLMQMVSVSLDAHWSNGILLLLVFAFFTAWVTLGLLYPVLQRVSEPRNNRQE